MNTEKAAQLIHTQKEANKQNSCLINKVMFHFSGAQQPNQWLGAASGYFDSVLTILSLKPQKDWSLKK